MRKQRPILVWSLYHLLVFVVQMSAVYKITFEAVKNRVFFRDFKLPEKVLINFCMYIIDANFAGFVHDYQI